MRLPSLDRIAFAWGLFVVAFLYGIATQAFGWFPADLLQRAWDQARAVAPVSGLISEGGGQGPEWLTSRVHDRTGARTLLPDRVQPGMTLVGSGWELAEGPAPQLRLVDRSGEVVHRWTVRPEEIFPDTTDSPGGELAGIGINGQHLFPNGDVLVNVRYVGAVRLDACGRVKWRNTAYSFHHSVQRADDGTFWVPGVERSLPARSEAYPEGYPGLEGPLHRSLIVRLAGDGTVVETINVLDVLYENGLQRHIPRSMLGWEDEGFIGWADLVHLNDVDPLPDSLAGDYPLFDAGDLAVSLRNPNLVFVLDPESGEVEWHTSHPFVDQHDPDFVGDGWIGIFDNARDGTERGTMLGGSRIVLRQPHTDSTRVIFPTAESDTFYTSVQGEWQMLGNGNLLLTESQAGRVLEVAPDGRTVWEWIHAPHGDTTVAEVGKASRVRLSRETVSSWPCSE